MSGKDVSLVLTVQVMSGCNGTRALNNEIEEAERQREERNTEREKETYSIKCISTKCSELGFLTSGVQHKKTWWLLASSFLNFLEMTTWNLTVAVYFVLQQHIELKTGQHANEQKVSGWADGWWCGWGN